MSSNEIKTSYRVWNWVWLEQLGECVWLWLQTLLGGFRPGLLWTPPSVMFTCVHVLCVTDSPLTVIKTLPQTFHSQSAGDDDKEVLFSSTPGLCSTLCDSSHHHHTVYSSLHQGVASSHGGKTQTFRPPPSLLPTSVLKDIELWLFFFNRMIGLIPTRSKDNYQYLH